MERLYAYIDAHRDTYVEFLRRLIRIPSVSFHNQGIDEGARYVASALGELGAEISTLRALDGLPLIVGAFSGKSAKTLLLYNHYDVVPVEPVEAWTSPPFGAETKDGRVIGRGASDNKGELAARICAINAYRAVRGDLPTAIKFVVDGEEEIGSPHLQEVVEANHALLRADAAFGEGSHRDALGRPTVSLGCRGRVLFEMESVGARQTFHSSLTALVPNPAWDIVWAFASMKGRDERVTIEGFHDAVVPPSDEELTCLEAIHFDDAATKRLLGIPALTLGLSGREAVCRLLLEPTVEISGLGAGRVLDGLKGMPRRAVGVVRFGLVPNQDPSKMEAILRRHLDRFGFQRIALKPISYRHPGKVPLDHPFARMIIRSAREFLGEEPVVYPVAPWIGAPYHELADPLGIPLVNVGLASADSRFHAPDESLDLDGYIESIKFAARLFHDFSGLEPMDEGDEQT